MVGSAVSHVYDFLVSFLNNLHNDTASYHQFRLTSTSYEIEAQRWLHSSLLHNITRKDRSARYDPQSWTGAEVHE